MALLLDGLPNKRIADRLGISTRTVEVHRARVLDKMGARNAVELAGLVYSRSLASMGLATARTLHEVDAGEAPD